MTPFEISKQISSYRFHYSGGEKDVQLGIAKIFGDVLRREYALSPSDRPDFFLEADGIVIEVKVKGSAGSVLYQLERYAKHDAVKGLVLVTTRRRQALRMPYILEGKPLVVCCLSTL